MSSDADQPLSALRVIIAGIVWRLLGTNSAGSTLLQAMTGADEQNRMLAGMSLVKAGDRSLRLIEEKINQETKSVALIRLLPDVGGEKARSLLERIAARDAGDAAEAATECIDLLDRMNSL
jgi:radical SAM superfamily enzyme with C-terminal helix-hairpin-helix motif